MRTQRSSRAGTAIAGWVINIISLAAIVSSPIAGRASDLFGSKRVFIAALILFTLGSMLSALAPNLCVLILFRLVQGIGMGSFSTASYGIIAASFPESRQRAIGLVTSIFNVGMIIGPNLGGWLIESNGWRSVFWLGVPFGAGNGRARHRSAR